MNYWWVNFGCACGRAWVKVYDFFFPAPRIEFMVGATGSAPQPGPNRNGGITLSYRADLFVQQMLHDENPGGTQTFALDVWVRVPDDHHAILVPVLSEWVGGRLLPLPMYFAPGWSGELAYTAFNTHPEEPAGLPAGREGFEIHLVPTAGRAWLTDKS